MSKPAGPYAIRLIKEFEKGDPLVVPCTTEGAALGAYYCSAGKPTIGFGCTVDFDNKPVQIGDVLSEDQVEPLMIHNLQPIVDDVDAQLTQVVSPHQRDALIALAYNVGIYEFSKPCTALRETNAGNWEKAAEAFALFTGATTQHPSDKQVRKPEYADVIGRDGSKWIWLGPERQKCGYMTRLRGLLRRHLAEGVLYSGYDWAEACADDQVKITLKAPSAKLWNAGRNRWEDRIEYQTSLADVLVTAKRYPLVEDEEIFEAPADAPRQTAPVSVEIAPPGAEEGETKQNTLPIDSEPLPHEAEASPALPLQPSAQGVPAAFPTPAFGQDAPVKAPVEVVPIPVPIPLPKPPLVDTPYGQLSPDPKDMFRSQRFWGGCFQVIGRFGSRIGLPAGAVGVISDPVVSTMLVTLAVLGSALVIEHLGEWLLARGRRHAVAVMH